eukprot:7520133-Ditylum_brightwellii.AAC.1
MGNAAISSGKKRDSAECRTYSAGDGCCEDCNDGKLHHFGGGDKTLQVKGPNFLEKLGRRDDLMAAETETIVTTTTFQALFFKALTIL